MSKYLENVKKIDELIRPDLSFDIVKRELKIGGRSAVMYFIDGYIKDEVYEKIYEYFFAITPEEISAIQNMDCFSKTKMPYVEISVCDDVKNACLNILSGPAVLLIDGVNDILVIDTRKYPVRSISEPEKDKSLRGSRDGFVETLIFNTSMIRRRIRDERLRMEFMQIGGSSHVDIAISYLDGVADKDTIKIIKERLSSIDVSGISMTQQVLSEKLVKTSFLNPYPKFKFTERPDYASAALLEGKIVIAMDNSPNVIIVPTTFADFFKETNDYYFPPLVGTYTRTLRLIVSSLTVVLIPFYQLLIDNATTVPEWLKFLLPDSSAGVSVFLQFIILEFVIDGLKLASLNTPNTLSNALGIIGGLLLSELAISAGWFNPQTVLFMSFVAISTYSQPSFEMGYAMKFERIVLLVLTRFLGIVGLISGVILFFTVKLFTRTLSGKNYLYPIIPFDLKKFGEMFIRKRI